MLGSSTFEHNRPDEEHANDHGARHRPPRRALTPLPENCCRPAFARRSDVLGPSQPVPPYLVTGAETGGAYFVDQGIVPPGDQPHPHVHRQQEQERTTSSKATIRVPPQPDRIVIATAADYMNLLHSARSSSPPATPTRHRPRLIASPSAQRASGSPSKNTRAHKRHRTAPAGRRRRERSLSAAPKQRPATDSIPHLSPIALTRITHRRTTTEGRRP